ncbi:hypothetical protein M427DRAFT_402398 [Gonapodya prolifera JEL478]|uniref:Uncharacterized protein n=1 Tax=Gonapodya prolifera (strain JEL478) TaxID=1344416 RepID=A0A139ATQ1_GONPJ|nr:hypothetical protein M427DRAFT_402398 [Gonapodya prolifera JEL478]|eukprot:KXS20110.1 hypothetical protein M427DRAFT_402398 [Gonapodya prolifera JEL478]
MARAAALSSSTVCNIFVSPLLRLPNHHIKGQCHFLRCLRICTCIQKFPDRLHVLSLHRLTVVGRPKCELNVFSNDWVDKAHARPIEAPILAHIHSHLGLHSRATTHYTKPVHLPTAWV